MAEIYNGTLWSLKIDIMLEIRKRDLVKTKLALKHTLIFNF